MPPTGHTRVILELELAADPIAGNVVDRLGRGHPFSGWMALTRTIELALDAARQATPTRQPDSTPEKVAPDPPMPFTSPSTSADRSTTTKRTPR
jgi:hypothetical protein